MKQDELTLNLLIICFWIGDCKLIDDLNYEYIIEQRNFKALKDCFPYNERNFIYTEANYIGDY